MKAAREGSHVNEGRQRRQPCEYTAAREGSHANAGRQRRQPCEYTAAQAEDMSLRDREGKGIMEKYGLSRTHTDELYWLGRYTERVYTSLDLFASVFDEMIDGDPAAYKAMLRNLEITDIYTDKRDFNRRYCFDKSNPDSIRYSLERGFDNAVILREVIGSASLSYIQVAIYEMDTAEKSESPMIDLQGVQDRIVAFWGMTDDVILDERVRNLLKVGKIVERIDLYSRMNKDMWRIAREVERLQGRIDKSEINYDGKRLQRLYDLSHGKSEPGSLPSFEAYQMIVENIESLI